ncbi:MAG: nitrilase-related carbon-nitrogen hydrolase [Betaproteobacteria bacterium]|jgi:predicted amidohydrolase
MSSNSNLYGPYRALALQTRCEAVNSITDVAACRTQMMRSIERIDRQIAASKMFSGDDLKLVVLPEYFLTSFPTGPDLPTWAARACLLQDGPEYKALGEVAKKNGVYLSGNAYEIDPKFSDLSFQVSFIINDQGELILRYRRLISMYTATPHDVWDKFVDIYGVEAAFPVADTPLGTLACIASEEILFPEVARALALRGAEIFLHSSSETGSPQATKKGIAKRARAVENLAYVVSANSAGIAGIDVPMASTDSGSMVIDYEGRILAEAGYGESMVALTQIDPATIRHVRGRVGMDNYLARLRLEPFASTYQMSVYPPNVLANDKPSRAGFRAAIERGIAAIQNKATSK